MLHSMLGGGTFHKHKAEWGDRECGKARERSGNFKLVGQK